MHRRGVSAAGYNEENGWLAGHRIWRWQWRTLAAKAMACGSGWHHAKAEKLKASGVIRLAKSINIWWHENESGRHNISEMA
jgi:hypothetical protein